MKTKKNKKSIRLMTAKRHFKTGDAYNIFVSTENAPPTKMTLTF